MTSSLSEDLASLKINRQPAAKPGKNRFVRYVIWGGLIVGMGLFIAMWGWPRIESRLFRTEVTTTEVALISPVQSAVQLTATGYVTPQTLSKVGSKWAGKVKYVAVKMNDLIEKGDLLLELDDAEQRAILSTAQARVQGMQARLKATQETLKETEQKLRRSQELQKVGAEPQSVVQDLQAHAASLQAAVKSASADTQTANAESQNAQTLLRELRIFSPMKGTVITKPPTIGEMVTPNSPLMELADLSSLVVEVDVPENRVDKVTKGKPCEIVLDALPEERLRGRVAEITPRFNRAKASLLVKVAFEDKPSILLPDMAARVQFLNAEVDPQKRQDKPKVFVPKNAITRRNGVEVVFVIEQEQAIARDVVLGEAMGDGYELKQGPVPGSKIVKNPPALLRDGQRIKEKN